MQGSWPLLLVGLVTVCQLPGLQGRRTTNGGGTPASGLRGGGSRRGTLPLPHPFGGGGVGSLSGLGSSSSAPAYYDSEESKYALWGVGDPPPLSRKKDGRGGGRRTPGPLPRKPNIILMLADDQDIELGLSGRINVDMRTGTYSFTWIPNHPST